MTPADDTESVEITALKRSLADMCQQRNEVMQENWFLKREVECLRNDEPKRANQAVFARMQAKIMRQRAAINNIQRRGWEPKYIIQEESYV